MKPLSFKEAVSNDVQGVFLDTEEFADLHTIKYGGKVYTDIPVSLQDIEETDREQQKDDHLPGIFRAKAVLFCALSDLGGTLPEHGTKIEISSPRNKRFFHKYDIGSAGEEMGMVRLELGRFAQ